ncbi:fimbrial protein [Salmonella enterica subsp. enterica]|nr:fimbrial protein [Salmonella enterica subsp. enterica serovar Poona]EHQ2774047.1 fimbrial protein [Salmonella enterica]
MKKLMIASAIAMTMTAGSAMAAGQQSEIQFLGVVTSVTCDIDSSVNGNATNIVQLGSVTAGAQGTPVDFSLKAQDPTAAGCAALAGKTATIAFLGALGDNGLENGTGTATKAHVTLKTLNGKTTAEQEIKKGSSSVTFAADKLVGANPEGYKFQAKLVSEAGGTEGTFDSALAYAVTYQ